jgi:hypothetical protein
VAVAVVAVVAVAAVVAVHCHVVQPVTGNIRRIYWPSPVDGVPRQPAKLRRRPTTRVCLISIR